MNNILDEYITALKGRFPSARIEIFCGASGAAKVNIFIGQDMYVFEMMPDGECGVEKIQDNSIPFVGYEHCFESVEEGLSFLTRLISENIE